MDTDIGANRQKYQEREELQKCPPTPLSVAAALSTSLDTFHQSDNMDLSRNIIYIGLKPKSEIQMSFKKSQSTLIAFYLEIEYETFPFIKSDFPFLKYLSFVYGGNRIDSETKRQTIILLIYHFSFSKTEECIFLFSTRVFFLCWCDRVHGRYVIIRICKRYSSEHFCLKAVEELQWNTQGHCRWKVFIGPNCSGSKRLPQAQLFWANYSQRA